MANTKTTRRWHVPGSDLDLATADPSYLEVCDAAVAKMAAIRTDLLSLINRMELIQGTAYRPLDNAASLAHEAMRLASTALDRACRPDEVVHGVRLHKMADSVVDWSRTIPARRYRSPDGSEWEGE